MISNRLVLKFAAAIIFCIFTGCASQTATVMETMPLSSASQTDQPSILNEATPASINKEEILDQLLEDDWDDLDDWENEDESQEFATIADPLEPFNRAMFYLNDKLYFWILKPISQGYRAITPQAVRLGVKNFFFNLATPIRMANCILQGKGRAAAAEFSSFLINSSFGVLGFGDLTKDYPELNPDPEDLGQTLATYGIGDGFYIHWPILGDATLRDTFGRVGDAFLDPINQIEPLETSIAVSAFSKINNISFRIGDLEAMKKATLDPYEASRNFYIQSRKARIKK